jgi:hypothetical protein
MNPTPRPFHSLAFGAIVLFAACANHNVNNEESAQRAYLGLDHAVDRAMNLGFAGFNAASSANIPPQTGMGDVAGTMTVSGQVDHGASSNRQMRLQTDLAGYEDVVPVAAGSSDASMTHLVYDTGGDAGAPPALGFSMMNVPNGTFTGSWTGSVAMSGDLMGIVMLNLMFAGNLQPSPTDATMIQRVPGSTHITGTVTSPYGTYTVDLTR